MKKNKIKRIKGKIIAFIFIEAPLEKVGSELIRWGTGEWWPKESLIQYIYPSGADGPKEGMALTVKLLMPLANDLQVKIVQLDKEKGITMTFQKGFLEGKEQIVLESRYNGTRVNYVMEYTVPNFIYGLLWKFVFKSKYLASIKYILASLRKYVLKQNTSSEENK